MERLVTAYQEELLPLDELRRRMPELRAREQSARAELQAILDQAADRMSFLRLAETLTAFLQRLHESVKSLEIADRQKIVRLLVKDILVDNDTITIRHSIPSHPRTPPPGTEPPSDGKSQAADQSYLLRSGGGPSPVLANLFLHYTFDLWMARTFPHLRWCRYADDGLVHCRTEKEARAVWIALNSRMAECRLEVHPTKTKIVYCRDGRRKGKFENVAFDFLGYGFRPRSVKGRPRRECSAGTRLR